MSTTTPSDADSKKESFGELLRKFALASVGAVVLAQEEIEEFVRRLVEKGELAEKDGKSLVRDLLERRKKAAADRETKGVAPLPTADVDRTIDRVLHRINVPTKGDIDELAKKIDAIEQKIVSLGAKR